MFRRKIYDQLKEWKETRQGESALLIEGPRRVGKSTVVEAFAKKEYKSYILIDFAECQKAILELFEDIQDLDFFFLRLQTVTHTNLIERKSLIIFDEVQRCPLARQAIKRLVRDRRYDYIETGSLISIRQNVKDILIPSEEQRLHMNPMDFEEFLWALGDQVTFSILRKFYDSRLPLGDGVHREVMRTFRLYMLVGGMPQAVSAYLNSNNFSVVDTVKRQILDLYLDDFYKIDGKGYLSDLFSSIPGQLNANTGRYAISGVVPTLRPSTALPLVTELIASRAVLAAYHTSSPTPGMAAFKDLTRFKLLLADTGLFTTLMFKTRAFTDNVLYQKLLSDKLSENLGYLFENVVAQMLTARGYELFYHTFPKASGTGKYEIDFLIARKNKICPIEVKSSGYLTHTSLDAFCAKYSAHVGEKYVICTKDYKKDGDVQFLPIYLAPFL